MPKLSRRTLVAGIGAFSADKCSTFLIDNVKLSFSASSDAVRSQILRAAAAVPLASLANTGQLGLQNPVPLARRQGPTGPTLFWKRDAEKFHLGTLGKSDRTLVGDFNPIRAVRSALPSRKKCQHARIPDNYLDPRVVPRPRAHDACMRYFEEWVQERCREYGAIVKSLWGVDLAPSDVLVSVNIIELAWDALTLGRASLVARLFWEGWRRSFAEARHVFEIARLEYEGDGMLKAVGRNGEILKLYRKTVDLVRFEAQLTRDAAREALGRRLDPNQPAEFYAGLQEIASSVYASILDIQELAVAPATPDLLGIAAVIRAGTANKSSARAESARYIMDQLIHAGVLRKRGQTDYKVLSDLRADGIVQIGPRKGCWTATPEYAEVLLQVRRVIENGALWRAK